jgi:DNA integrity scanning protein DisA with diadenylate cyclase activity
MADKRIQILITTTEEQRHRLRQLAHQESLRQNRDVSMNELAKEALDAFLEAQEQLDKKKGGK